jgi:hypothetical protein
MKVTFTKNSKSLLNNVVAVAVADIRWLDKQGANKFETELERQTGLPFDALLIGEFEICEDGSMVASVKLLRAKPASVPAHVYVGMVAVEFKSLSALPLPALGS